ncbi:hypothetical protein [Marispirochaeta aestuarii]|uniref:hypothetical protein n=1 Tax=Marispirochaeta aestuarii TaxID=1963862 RepID=UPI002ABE8035|nr:hypothetical protein [Marispirochaeta aestuarii]
MATMKELLEQQKIIRRNIVNRNTPGAEPAHDDSKDELVARAVELGIDSPSVLKRWGPDRLKAAIEDAEQASQDEAGQVNEGTEE